MIDKILAFLDALDAALVPLAQGELLPLYLLGRSSLILRYQPPGTTTRDIDVVRNRRCRLQEEAKRLFGAGTANASAYGLYLETVAEGLPPVPAGFERRCRPYERPGMPWRVIRVYQMDPNDLAVTKLKRFSTRDRQDLRLLCDRGDLDVQRVKESLELAWCWHMEKDGNPQRDRAFANFQALRAYLEGEVTSL